MKQQIPVRYQNSAIGQIDMVNFRHIGVMIPIDHYRLNLQIPAKTLDCLKTFPASRTVLFAPHFNRVPIQHHRRTASDEWSQLLDIGENSRRMTQMEVGQDAEGFWKTHSIALRL